METKGLTEINGTWKKTNKDTQILCVKPFFNKIVFFFPLFQLIFIAIIIVHCL